jgi:serine/threonine-protein kinase
MGEVYRAWHAMLERWCAVKLLSGDVSERDLARFAREVRLTAQLSHPNTVSIYDFGRAPDGSFYYAMELLEGTSLQELVDKYGAQPPPESSTSRGSLRGAREAHGAGLIHRDVAD